MKIDKTSFSLVELIIIIVIAAIAIPGVVFIFHEVSRKSVYDEAMSSAVMLAEGELERVIQKSFSSITDENRDSPVPFGAGFSGYNWQIRVDAVPSNLASDSGMLQYKQVESRVTNNLIGDISLKTVVTNN